MFPNNSTSLTDMNSTVEIRNKETVKQKIPCATGLAVCWPRVAMPWDERDKRRSSPRESRLSRAMLRLVGSLLLQIRVASRTSVVTF